MTSSPDGEAVTTLVDQTTLAVERTFLAYERSLLAWIRTATSTITFGFSIYKYFQYLGDSGQVVLGGRWVGPRVYGIGMIAVGVAMLLVGIWQYRQGLRRLPAPYSSASVSLTTVTAAVIATLGLGALVIVILNE